MKKMQNGINQKNVMYHFSGGLKMYMRVFLESEEYGCEYFGGAADIEKLLSSAKRMTAEDGITRRVGYEILEDENG